MADITIEHASGPAGEDANTAELYVSFLRRTLIVPRLSLEGGLAISEWNFLAYWTSFKMPGYLSHLNRLFLEWESWGM